VRKILGGRLKDIEPKYDKFTGIDGIKRIKNRSTPRELRDNKLTDCIDNTSNYGYRFWTLKGSSSIAVGLHPRKSKHEFSTL